MATKILILGDSGTGKSASLRNFKPEELLVINSAGKPLPFKNHFETVTPAFTKLASDVIKAMDGTNKKVIIIDDAQYIMSFQYMRRIKENGWEKWNDIQGDFFNIIQHCDELPSDVIVYFLSHIQRDEEGHEKLKTMGKMLDEKITLEGLFTVVLKTSVTDGQYCFVTQNSGKDTVKSPIGMFDSYAIDNDLKYVDTKIRNYYEIGEFASDEVVSAMDQEASKMVEKPERKRRRAVVDTANTSPVTNTVADTADSKPAEAETPVEAPKKLTPEEKIQIEADIAAMNQEVNEATKEAESGKRRRKVRNGEDKEEVNKEASVEEAKAETTAGTTTEGAKRKRRKRITDDDGISNLEAPDLPFEMI